MEDKPFKHRDGERNWLETGEKEGNMEKVKKRAKVWLCIAIALMLISMISVSVIQTSGGKVTIKELAWETDEGLTMHGDLFVPEGASAENKLPAVVTSHGTYNNKEMQDANFVELSRRGFIVLTIDCPLHGDSEVGVPMLTDEDPSKLGIWEGVLMLSRLPYVDTEKIGVTGHSRGGENCGFAVQYDNEAGTNLIASVLFNGYDPVFVDAETGEYTNVFGNRDVGVIACVYDEFFHRHQDENGTTLWAPHYMESANAQSFLYFGTDPSGQEPRDAFTMYHEEIDGKDSVRVIYRPEIIHPWSHFSTKSTAYTIEFFTETLGAPNAIDSGNQIWPIKEAMNSVGLIGLVIFVISFSTLMVFTPYFSELRASAAVMPLKVDKKGKVWFWGTLIVSAVFASLIFVPVVSKALTVKVDQVQSFGLGLWSALCGLVAIILMVLSYTLYGKKNGMDLTARGVKMPVRKLLKTILLAIIVICVGISWVFFADYFFNSDFRFWTLTLKTFEPEMLFRTLKYLGLFLLFYVPASVAANSFNYNNVGKKSWVNLLIVTVFVAFPALILPWIQYIVYYNTTFPFFGLSNNREVMVVLWLFPTLLILVAATIQSRILYKVTNNPYLSGIIMGTFVAITICTNTMTVVV